MLFFSCTNFSKKWYLGGRQIGGLIHADLFTASLLWLAHQATAFLKHLFILTSSVVAATRSMTRSSSPSSRPTPGRRYPYGEWRPPGRGGRPSRSVCWSNGRAGGLAPKLAVAAALPWLLAFRAALATHGLPPRSAVLAGADCHIQRGQ